MRITRNQFVSNTVVCEARNVGAIPAMVPCRCSACFYALAMMVCLTTAGAVTAVATRVLARTMCCGGNIQGCSETSIRPSVEYPAQGYAALYAWHHISGRIVFPQGLLDS